MADIVGLENKLNDTFGKQAPKMPKGLYDFLVQYAPILTMVGAVVSLFGAWGLWRATRVSSGLVNLANELSRSYGGDTISTNKLTLFVWLGIGLMAFNAVLYFMAYNPLKNHAKRGWDLLFYVALVNIAYSVVTLFIDGEGFGSFLFGLVFSAIGFWILFQICPAYLEKKHSEHKE